MTTDQHIGTRPSTPDTLIDPHHERRWLILAVALTAQVMILLDALPPQRRAEQAGTDFTAAAGCSSAHCLRQLSVAEVIKTAGSGFQYAGGHGTTAPTLNRTALPESFSTALRAGRSHDMPVMFGYARDENLTGTPTMPESYRRLVHAQYGAAADAVLKQYPATAFVSPFVAWRTVAADSNTVCPALSIDREMSRRSPTYAFEMDDPNAVPDAFEPPGLPNGNHHDADWFLFDIGLPAPTTANERVIEQQELVAVSAFARTGTPTPEASRPGHRSGKTRRSCHSSPAATPRHCPLPRSPRCTTAASGPASTPPAADPSESTWPVGACPAASGSTP